MCMGPPRAIYQQARLRRVYPHVYGATIPMKQMALLARGLSPCVWGHHVARCNSCIDYGSIPMCMGPPCRSRSEEHTSELQSRGHLVCRLLLEEKNPGM